MRTIRVFSGLFLLLGAAFAKGPGRNIDWPTYHGDMSGNRFTRITQITEIHGAAFSVRLRVWCLSMKTVECSSPWRQGRAF
ncbi:MAG TPA: hypothetical protein VGK48_29360 [Terriglobia bacterium]|jgi:hypothetical protein